MQNSQDSFLWLKLRIQNFHYIFQMVRALWLAKLANHRFRDTGFAFCMQFLLFGTVINTVFGSCLLSSYSERSPLARWADRISTRIHLFMLESASFCLTMYTWWRWEFCAIDFRDNRLIFLLFCLVHVSENVDDALLSKSCQSATENHEITSSPVTSEATVKSGKAVSFWKASQRTKP